MKIKIERGSWDRKTLEPEERKYLILSLLLHDIGQLPFSHILEGVLPEQQHHEMIGLNLLKEQGDVRDNFDRYFEELCGGSNGSKKYLEQIGLVTIPEKLEYLQNHDGEIDKNDVLDTVSYLLGKDKEEGEKFLEEKGITPALRDMVSGPIDIDRIDHLSRDVYFFGGIGDFAKDAILSGYRIAEEKASGEMKLCLSSKALPALKQMLYTRELLYEYFYDDPWVRGCEIMLQQAVLNLITDENYGEFPHPVYVYTDYHLLHDLITHGKNSTKILAQQLLHRTPMYGRVYEADIMETDKYTIETAIPGLYKENRIAKEANELQQTLRENIRKSVRVPIDNFPWDSAIIVKIPPQLPSEHAPDIYIYNEDKKRVETLSSYDQTLGEYFKQSEWRRFKIRVYVFPFLDLNQNITKNVKDIMERWLDEHGIKIK